MAPAEPRLQHKLLVWLMGPLMALLVLDTAASYWIALRFSNLAHDRALQEIAREVVLHVRPSGGGPKLDISPAVERVLLTDQDDVARYKVSAVGGGFIGGDPDLPTPAGGNSASGKTVFYEATMQGKPVRVFDNGRGPFRRLHADRSAAHRQSFRDRWRSWRRIRNPWISGGIR
ncbi:MAG: sensor histidine kinase N-terminal domain-containing protein, partial [Betaproteobacteria bacterium]